MLSNVNRSLRNKLEKAYKLFFAYCVELIEWWPADGTVPHDRTYFRIVSS